MVKREKGQSLVEFAFTLPFLVMFLMCILYVGMLITDYMSVTSMAREVARSAAVVDLKGKKTYEELGKAYGEVGANYSKFYESKSSLLMYRLEDIAIDQESVDPHKKGNDAVRASVTVKIKDERDTNFFIFKSLRLVFPEELKSSTVMRREDELS